jgi:hypothetical protein
MNKKRLFKHLLCLLSLFGFLISCQTEEVVLKQFGKDIPVTKKQVRYLDSKQSRHISAKLATKFNKPFGKNDTNNFTVLSTNVGEIDLTKVLEITNEFGVTNYTYLVKPTSITLEKFYNIVYSTSDDKEKIVLVEYLMTDEFKDDYYSKIKTISQFKGTITSTIISNSFPCTDPPIVPITDIIDGGSEASNYPSDSSDFNPISGGGSPINNPGDIINDQEPISGGGSTGACYWEVVVIECSGGLGHNGSQVCYAEFKGATYLRNSCTGEMIRVFKNGTTKKGENSEESDGDMGDPCPPADGIGIIEPSSAFMSFIFSLPTDLKNWLTKPYPLGASDEIKDMIENYVNSANADLAFAEELTSLMYSDVNQQDIYNNGQLTILSKNHESNYFDSDLEDTFIQYSDLNTLSPPWHNPFAGLTLQVYFNYKKLRSINPEWSKTKCMYYATKEIIHMSLDAFGLIPVFGEVADLVNGALYTIEGNHLDASLSYASAVPVVGWAAVSTRYALRVVNVANDVSTKVKLVWKVLPGGTIYFGSNSHCRSTLRKILGLGVGNANQAHHIIPLNKQTHPAIQKAAKSGSAFHMNEALNGIPLSTAVHSGSHNNYDTLVESYLDAIPNNATPQQAYNQVETLINNIRIAIQNNPNTPINQLNF